MAKIHPREKIVNDSRRRLRAILLELEKELTAGEYLGIIGSAIAQEIGHRAKYEVRFERHGNYDTPGGFE